MLKEQKVTVETPDQTLTEWLITGEDLASDQTALLHFGLGKQTEISKVTVHYSNGETEEVLTPKINSLIDMIKVCEARLKIIDINYCPNYDSAIVSHVLC